MQSIRRLLTPKICRKYLPQNNGISTVFKADFPTLRKYSESVNKNLKTSLDNSIDDSYQRNFVTEIKRGQKVHGFLNPNAKSRRTATINERFDLELGGHFPSLDITWEEWGPSDAPVVMVIPSLSMGSHACSSISDPTPGWWEGAIGHGKAIDTTRFRVICPSILGGPFGTTNPTSIDPKTGKRYGPNFPTITTLDQARVHMKLLKHLKIPKLYAMVGSSLGGMQTLSFASEYQHFVEKIVVTCATGKSSPGTVALRRVQRSAILSDPDYENGNYAPDKGPFSGLAVARQLGTICYRSREEFNQRFKWEPEAPYSPHSLTFEVEKYLDAQANRFNHYYDANCYLFLSRCMDLMDLGRNYNKDYEEGVKRITAKTFLIAFDQDSLIPKEEMASVAYLLQAHGRDVTYETHPSLFGHDAFLKEYDWLNPKIHRFLIDS